MTRLPQAIDMSRDPDGTAYYEVGRGTPVVLLHGVGLNALMWRPVAELLAPRCRVIVPDLLGHGQSPLPPVEAGIGHYSDQIVALMRHVGVEHACVAGFSMGALVAQRLAIDHPALVHRLTLVSAVFDRSVEEQLAVRTRALSTAVRGIAPSVQPAIARWFSPSFAALRPELVEWVRETMLANDAVGYLRSYAVFALADQALKDDVARIGAPTLVVAGSDDSGSTPRMATRLHEVIAGSRLAILQGCRHLLPLEVTDQLAMLLQDFFDETAGGKA